MIRIKYDVALMVVTVFGIGVGLICSGAENASAVTADELEYFAQNDMPFYEPCGGTSGDSSSGICGTNQNYAGEQVWTDEQMKALKANQPFYEKAAQAYGIPWQLIAVIHMRETGLGRNNPENGQGAYQFYSAEERAKCKGGVFTPGNNSDEQFQIQTDCAARRIKENYGAGLDLTKDDDIKLMFFKYNGMAEVYKKQALALGFSQEEADRGEGSPYVMNRYDAKREPSSTWGQIMHDEGPIEYPANNQFGAFVLYKAITCDGSSSDNLTTEESDGNDAATEIDEVGVNMGNKLDSIAGDRLKTDVVLAAKKEKDNTGGKNGTSWSTTPGKSDDGYNEDMKEGEDGDEDDVDGGESDGTEENGEEGSEYTGGGAGSGINCGGNDANNDGANTNNINETAFKLAWPLGTPEEKYAVKKGGAPTDAYKKAVKELGLTGHGFTHTPDCGCFVTTVVRYSGVDKKFQKCGAGVPNKTYAEKHKDKWEVIEWNGDRSKVQAGDVITAWRTPGSSQHSFIILEKDGVMYRADAHYNAKEWGRITKLKKKYNSFPHKYIIRAKSSVATNGTPKAGGQVVKDNQGNGDIGASAIALAWPEGTDESIYKSKPTDKFANYYKTLDASKSGDDCAATGKSCDRFAYAAVKYSGVEGEITYGFVDTKVYPDILKNDAWSEVKMSNPKSLDEYKSGDLLFFWKPGVNPEASGPTHIAVFAEDSEGKKHVVQASYCGEYGIVKDTGAITGSYWGTVKAFRNNSNTQNGVAECDSCATEANNEENDGDGSLKDGGLTLKEAKKLVEIYKGYAGANNMTGDMQAANKYFVDYGCHGNVFLNCPSFVRYFINRYTTKTWAHVATGNGKDVASNVARDLSLPNGKTPKPYSVFSDHSYSPGHTGIVLGVNAAKKTMVVGEACCLDSQSRQAAYNCIKAEERSVKRYSDYTYLDSIVKLGE